MSALNGQLAVRCSFFCYPLKATLRATVLFVHTIRCSCRWTDSSSKSALKRDLLSVNQVQLPQRLDTTLVQDQFSLLPLRTQALLAIFFLMHIYCSEVSPIRQARLSGCSMSYHLPFLHKPDIVSLVDELSCQCRLPWSDTLTPTKDILKDSSYAVVLMFFRHWQRWLELERTLQIEWKSC